MNTSTYKVNSKPTILLVDGAHMLRRSMYQPALRGLSNNIGVPTGAIFGFLNSLKSAVNSLSCQGLVVCWEGGHSERRKQIYSEYKDRGDQGEPELDVHGYTDYQYYSHQLSWIKKILDSLGILQVSVQGKEGDDVLYQSSKILSGQKIIISEDRDFYTLISDDTSVFRPIKQELVDLASFRDITGYTTPKHYLYSKVLLGDGSDNIPSVAKGVGEKTIMTLLESVENEEDLSPFSILKVASNMTGHRYKKLVEAGESPIIRNLNLIDISKEPFDIFQLESIIDILKSSTSMDLQMTNKLLRYLDFNSDTINFIVNRLSLVSSFSLSNLVDNTYMKKYMMKQTGLC